MRVCGKEKRLVKKDSVRVLFLNYLFSFPHTHQQERPTLPNAQDRFLLPVHRVWWSGLFVCLSRAQTHTYTHPQEWVTLRPISRVSVLGKSVLPRVLVRVTLLLPAHLPVLIGHRVSHSGGCRCVLVCARALNHQTLTLTPSSRNKVVVGELVSN